jgi:ACS family glucarate transporter-like MFS transporter
MPADPSAPRPWSLVALLMATATAGYLCRTNLSIAGAQMMPDFGMSQAQMGQVFSAFLLGYAIFQAPGGLAADRWGAARVLGALPLAWVVLTLAMAAVPGRPGSALWWPGLIVVFALRFLMGAAAAPTYPASARAVSDWITPGLRATANGWVIGSVGLGSAIAPLLMAWSMSQWGWRMAMVVSALPAAAMALVWLAASPPKRGQAPFANDLKRTDRANDAESAIGSPRFALLTLSYSLQGYVGYIFVFWFYLYLVQERHFDIVQGALFGSLPWVLSVVAIPTGGAISDRLTKGVLGPVWGRRAVPLAGMVGSGIFLSIGAHTGHPYVAAVSLALSTALVLSVEGPFWATANDLAGARAGLGGGIMNTGCNIGGLISPALTPALAAAIGWEAALHLAAALAVVSGLLWLGIGRSAIRPLGR